MKNTDNIILLSVNTIQERDEIIKDMYKTLTSQAGRNYIIQKDRVNRIRVYHKQKNIQILINTYVVVILPVLLDFSPLNDLIGTVDFRLDKTIDRLIKLTGRLQMLQGKRTVSGFGGAEKLKKALISLV